ncbi:MAG: HAD family phosphatase [Saprospiraceae bacterium]|nr:HAD family phosphatase [Saprospiraceae bacterium]
MAINNIVFDFGGVLLDLDVNRTYEALRQVMGFEGNGHHIYEQHRDIFDSFEMGHTIVENFLWKLQNKSKRVPPVDKLIAAWNAMLLGWNPAKLELLGELKRQYKTFLLSNTNELHIEWVRRDLKNKHQITDFDTRFFEKTYYSHLIGMRKPNVDIFEFIIADANIDPAETLFIDDNVHNIETAADLGFQTRLHETNANLDFLIG